MRKKFFSEEIGGYLDKPYKFGGKDSSGYNAIGLVYDFYKNRGIDFPTTYGEYTIDNIHLIWKERKDIAEEALLNTIKDIGKNIPVGEQVAADLVVMMIGESMFPGIYIGNNSVLMGTFKGVRSIAIDDLCYPILVRRLS